MRWTSSSTARTSGADGGDVQRVRRRLLTDHGLRIGHEPDTRVITDAARYQLGARVVDRFTGEVRLLTDHPETAIQNLLALDSAMSEHLVQPADVRRLDAEARSGFEAALADEARARTARPPRAGREGPLGDRPPPGAAGPRRGLPPAQARPRADGLLRPDRARRPAGERPAGRRCERAVEVQGGPPRRVPRHLRRPGRDALPALLGARPRAAAWGTRSPRSATPTRPSTAGAAPRSPTSSTSPTRSRRRPERSRSTCSPSTAAPTGGSSMSPTGWPHRSTTSTARSTGWSPWRGPTTASSPRRGLRHARRRAGPARRGRPGGPRRQLVEDRRADPQTNSRTRRTCSTR